MTNKDTYPKKNNLLLKTIIVFVILLSFFQVIAANLTASKGQEVGEINTQIEKLTKENQKLELQIESLTSLSQMEIRAKKLGFKKAGSFVFLAKPLPVALNLPK